MLSNVDQSHDRLVFFLIRNCKKIASPGKVVLNDLLQCIYFTENGITAGSYFGLVMTGLFFLVAYSHKCGLNHYFLFLKPSRQFYGSYDVCSANYL